MITSLVVHCLSAASEWQAGQLRWTRHACADLLKASSPDDLLHLIERLLDRRTHLSPHAAGEGGLDGTNFRWVPVQTTSSVSGLRARIGSCAVPMTLAPSLLSWELAEEAFEVQNRRMVDGGDWHVRRRFWRQARPGPLAGRRRIQQRLLPFVPIQRYPPRRLLLAILSTLPYPRRARMASQKVCRADDVRQPSGIVWPCLRPRCRHSRQPGPVCFA